MKQPLAIDLFCGLGGWTEGLLAEGYRVVGFDNERHVYSEARYPAQLVLQDVLTIHGAQFKDAALIVASPPCQAYSYRAMPWKRAKALPPPDNSLFEACFRIQREAIAATGHSRTCPECDGEAMTRGCCRCERCDGKGYVWVDTRHIPLVVENVCGAQKWVGRAKWHFGSFYLWGDVPALMPITKRAKVGDYGGHGRFPPGGLAQGAIDRATKVGGISLSGYGTPGYKAQAFNGTAEKRLREEGIKVASENGRRTDQGKGARFTSRDCGIENTIANAQDGCKQRGSGHAWYRGEVGSNSSKSSARKAASAHIAKIPEVLARHIARVYHPAAIEHTA